MAISAVIFLRADAQREQGAQAPVQGAVERGEGLVEQQQESGSTAKARASATRRARPSDNWPGKSPPWPSARTPRAARPERHRSGSARRAADCRRHCATAAGAAPETPCRAVRGGVVIAPENSRSSPAMMRSRLDLAAAGRADKRDDRAVLDAQARSARTPRARRRRPARRPCAKCRSQAPCSRHQLALRSSGRSTKVSARIISADEGQGIGEQKFEVEQLESLVHLEADAIGPAEQFDHQHDLPHQRQAAARGRREKGRELRRDAHGASAASG